MTISESLVAACLVLGAMAGSLQVWGVTATTAVAEEGRQERREQVEAELMASEARLRSYGEALPPLSDCGLQAQALAVALAAHPLRQGLRRQVSIREDGLVGVAVEAEGLAASTRRRLWSVAALGLCGSAPPPPPSPPLPLPTIPPPPEAP